MREPHDDVTPDAPVDWDPETEARRDTDELNLEKQISDTGTDYDAGFDETMTPLDESEDINEHGSER